MCGEDSRDIAGLPIDQIQEAIQPNDAQRAALDELANASLKAAQDIKAACPTQIVPTAPAGSPPCKVASRPWWAAVATVQPALEKFYGLLTDEQKERITALGQEQRRGRNAGALDQSCSAAPASVTDWPAADIERIGASDRGTTGGSLYRATGRRRQGGRHAQDRLLRRRSRSRRWRASRRSASGSKPCCKPSRP